jgi:hypothetical protein
MQRGQILNFEINNEPMSGTIERVVFRGTSEWVEDAKRDGRPYVELLVVKTTLGSVVVRERTIFPGEELAPGKMRTETEWHLFESVPQFLELWAAQTKLDRRAIEAAEYQQSARQV